MLISFQKQNSCRKAIRERVEEASQCDKWTGKNVGGSKCSIGKANRVNGTNICKSISPRI